LDLTHCPWKGSAPNKMAGALHSAWVEGTFSVSQEVKMEIPGHKPEAK